MTKIFLVLIAVYLTFPVRGQVVINLQLPAAGITLKSQLWNLSLVNTSNEEPNVQVEVLLSDAASNQPVVSGASRIFRLTKGVRLLQLTDLSPIVYNVLNSGYNVDASQNGFLPVGTFLVCYRVTKIVSDITERLAEECETIDVEPISPPILQMPFNEEEVEVPRPLFSWLPPSPHQLFNNLMYDLVLVEVLPVQNSSEAIQQNIPLYRQSNLHIASQAYPAGLPALDTSKLYAWQITAKSGFNAIAKSEIWTFRLKSLSRSSAIKRKGTYYAKLKRESDASYTVCTGVLHFEYNNEMNDKTIHCSIVDISSSARTKLSLDSSEYPVAVGGNFMNIDLRQVSNIRQGHIYLLEVVNVKQERWYLKFEFKKPD